MCIFSRAGPIQCGSCSRAQAIVNVAHASEERVRHGRLTLSPEEANTISSNQQILMRYNIELSCAAESEPQEPQQTKPNRIGFSLRRQLQRLVGWLSFPTSSRTSCANPIFDFQSFNSFEFLLIISDQNQSP